MLLLFFLQSERRELERRRILIDTLLHLHNNSAASVCRAAGVQAANLSALRRPEGGKHVSPELQERLLAVLGWGGGKPDQDVSHVWVVKDQNSLTALKWILEDRSTAEASFLPIGHTENSSLDLKWNGNLKAGGAACQITIASYLKLPDGTDGNSLMTSHMRQERRVQRIIQRDLEDKFEGDVAKQTLREVLKAGERGDFDSKTGGLFDQRRELGLTNEMLDKLIENWLSHQAKVNPDELMRRLSNIEKLKVGATEVSPKSMTPLQLQRYVTKIAKLTH